MNGLQEEAYRARLAAIANDNSLSLSPPACSSLPLSARPQQSDYKGTSLIRNSPPPRASIGP